MIERNETHDKLVDFLKDNEIILTLEPLESIKAFFVKSFAGTLRLAIADDLDNEEKVQIYLRALSHEILGHMDRPLASIVIPTTEKTKLTEDEIIWQRHAQSLGIAMISGTLDDLWERQDFQILYGAKKAEAQAVSIQLRRLLASS